MNKREIGKIIEVNVKNYIVRYGLESWSQLTFPEIRATEGLPSDLVETEFSGSDMSWESFLHEHIAEALA